MLRPIITLSVILICFNVRSQNWELFPVNQLSHYLIASETTSIRSFKSDSVMEQEDTRIHFFIQYTGPSEDCYWQNFKWLFGYNNEFIIDSLVYDHDSVVYYFLEGDYPLEFVFKPLAQPGDEWNLSSHLSRKGMCISAGISEVFGVSDSIKAFTLQTVLGDVEFILSKTYGLTQFIPFTFFFQEIPTDKKDEFPFLDYKLIGLQNDIEIKGFRMPGFPDYFHLSAGDQLLWKNKSWEINGPTTYFYKDSLLSSFISDDSVNYEILREEYDSTGQYLGNDELTVTYYKSDYEYLLQTPALWSATGNENLNGGLFIIDEMNMNILGSDTVFSKEFHNNGCFFEESEDECFVVCIDALYQIEYKLTSVEGLVYYSGFYGDEKELQGSIINGQLRGSMNIPPVGINYVQPIKFKVYPNPNTGKYIMVDLTDIEEPRELMITNLQGKVICRTTLLLNDIIRLELNLNNGIYFVNVVGKNYTFNTKFVVH